MRQVLVLLCFQQPLFRIIFLSSRMQRNRKLAAYIFRISKLLKDGWAADQFFTGFVENLGDGVDQLFVHGCVHAEKAFDSEGLSVSRFVPDRYRLGQWRGRRRGWLQEFFAVLRQCTPAGGRASGWPRSVRLWTGIPAKLWTASSLPFKTESTLAEKL